MGKVYGVARALVDVTLEVGAGRICAVVGPNGAGKTTLLGILATLTRPSSGEVATADRGEIGYVGHEPGVYSDLSARGNLAVFGGLHGIEGAPARADELLARVGLADAPVEAPVRTFSRGMLQRLALARALLHGPRLLLFDEPASALDPAGAQWLARELGAERAAGRAVVLVTHDLEAAGAMADHLVVLRRGRVVFDEVRAAPGFGGGEARRIYEERVRG